MSGSSPAEWTVLAKCIGGDTSPDEHEIDRLADRIWREIHPGGGPWSRVPIGSARHQAVMAIARSAAGVRSDLLKELPEEECRSLPVPRRSETPVPARGGGDPEAPLAEEDYAALASFRSHLRRFLAFSEKAAEGAGLTAQQYQTLLAIRAMPTGGASVGMLADQLLLAPHSMSGLLDRMCSAGFVERGRSSEDRRRVIVQLTDKGNRAVASLVGAHREELRQLAPVLRRLADQVDGGFL
jgi:DNA-binding MarR family transcriptional regulator